ncbi:uncharacterized protein LOC133290197 [Gastrolobium bilobum]|uniref:uncharacterized protein LOC133290197 n=1 Tax=Gastrolobium bilobum TaxID=150636 RepID=UPI002AAF3705|nr:uncharacterized protein LOC133290197 [Gastrolobium bilobum]
MFTIKKIVQAYQAPTGSLIHADTSNMTQVDIPEMKEASEAAILSLTEMVKICDDDEVNSAGQSLPMDTDDVYRVKSEFVPLLIKILNKHGDIAKNCTISTMEYRSMLLEMICDIFSELQDEDLSKIKEDNLQDMIFQILETKQILRQSSTLKEARESNRQIIENVERELEENEAEKNAVAEKLRSIYAKETVCQETLAKARDESTAIAATIADAKSKTRCFQECSLVDGLL